MYALRAQVEELVASHVSGIVGRTCKMDVANCKTPNISGCTKCVSLKRRDAIVKLINAAYEILQADDSEWSEVDQITTANQNSNVIIMTSRL